MHVVTFVFVRASFSGRPPRALMIQISCDYIWIYCDTISIFMLLEIQCRIDLIQPPYELVLANRI